MIQRVNFRVKHTFSRPPLVHSATGTRSPDERRYAASMKSLASNDEYDRRNRFPIGLTKIAPPHWLCTLLCWEICTNGVCGDNKVCAGMHGAFIGSEPEHVCRVLCVMFGTASSSGGDGTALKHLASSIACICSDGVATSQKQIPSALWNALEQPASRLSTSLRNATYRLG
jgi:hypothetical protein